MENRANFVITGIFLVTFTILALLFTLWMAKYDFNSNEYSLYKIHTKESISGLSKNSPVDYKGINIGSVHDIKINPQNSEEIIITIQVTTPNIVKVDSFAIIASKSITGLKGIEIVEGLNSSKNLLSDNENIPTIPLKKTFLDNITQKAEGITKDVEDILVGINSLIDKKFVKSIHDSMDNLKDFTQNLKDYDTNLESILKNFDKSSEYLYEQQTNIDKVVKKADKLLEEFNMENINNSTKNINDIALNINNLVKKDLTNIMGELNSTISSNSIDDLVIEFQGSLDNLNILLDKISNESSQMLLERHEKTYGPGETPDEL